MNQTPDRLHHRLGQLFRRPALLVLLILACANLLLFVPPNLTGAHDKNMLAAFQQDEYVQFGVLDSMLTADGSPIASLVDFVAYGHYYYGYPFYLTSTAFTFPLWVATGFATPADHTQSYMLLLRLMSLVPVSASILLIIWMWTRFRYVVRAAFIFLFLSVLPAVVYNNSWYHPDGLLTILVTLTIFALYRDNLAFGRWFVAAAVFCGLTAGTKVVGLFFFLTIAVYLLMGIQQGRLDWRRILIKGVLFVGVMGLTIVVSNPLLLVPRTSNQIFNTMFLQATGESQRGSSRGPLAWYVEQLRNDFGGWWLYLAAFAACVYGIVRGGKYRLLNIIILTWAIPFSLYCITVVTFKKSYYFIPIALPLFSCILNPEIWNFQGFMRARRWGALGLLSALVLIYLVNVPGYIENNTGMYRYFVNREAQSPSLAFYNKLDTQYLRLEHNQRLTIFRDPYIYIPPSDQYEIHMKWGAATYNDISAANPDLIVLQRSYIDSYARPNTSPTAMADSGRFYDDARRNGITGYHLLLEDEFGVAFLREQAELSQEAHP